MKNIALILFLLAGCASHSVAPLTPPVARLQTKSLASQPDTGIAPQWPAVTLQVAFSGIDTANSLYTDDWTNYWTCDALATQDLNQPREQWDRFPNITLQYLNNGGELGFEITTNTPWIYVTAQYFEKPTPPPLNAQLSTNN